MGVKTLPRSPSRSSPDSGRSGDCPLQAKSASGESSPRRLRVALLSRARGVVLRVRASQVVNCMGDDDSVVESGRLASGVLGQIGQKDQEEQASSPSYHPACNQVRQSQACYPLEPALAPSVLQRRSSLSLPSSHMLKGSGSRLSLQPPLQEEVFPAVGRLSLSLAYTQVKKFVDCLPRSHVRG